MLAGKFDVIISDLADPLDGGPCYQLYTQEFYRDIVLPKLNPGVPHCQYVCAVIRRLLLKHACRLRMSSCRHAVSPTQAHHGTPPLAKLST